MPHDMSPVIATRKSPLARKQTELVCECLRAHHSETVINVLPLSTKVDERLNWSLEKRGGLGLFTKELEAALLDGRADLAVHSAFAFGLCMHALLAPLACTVCSHSLSLWLCSVL